MTTIRWLAGLAFAACASLSLAHGPMAAPAVAASAPAASNAHARDLTMGLIDLGAQAEALPPVARARIVARLVALARERYDLLAALIEDDPEEVLRIALPPGLRAKLPAEAQALLERDADEDGEIEVLHVDHVTPADDYYVHTLKTAKGPVALHFAGEAPDLASGAHVRVRGIRVGDAIALAASDVSVVKAVSVLANTLGAQKTLVILVNFSDAPTLQPFTPTTAGNTVFATTSNYDYEASYQQTSLAGDVAGWYTIANPSTNCDYNTIASQAKQAAAAKGYVLSNYRRFVYAFPSNTCTWWGLGSVGGNPSQAWVHAKWGFTLPVIGHEMGHNYGLWHSHSLDCGAATVASSGCTTSEYGDIFDMMGSSNTTPHYNAYQKERLGWLNAGVSPPLTTVPASAGTATFTIAPMEDARNAAPRALKIPRGTSCAATGEWFYVESRQAKGFDAFLAGNANVLGGVLVRKVTDGVADSSYLLDMTPATTAWNDAALVAGKAFVDPQTGLSILPVSVGTTGATINVTFPPASCTRAAPKVAASPTGTVWTSAGSAASYSVTVTNQDSCGCAATTFDVGGVVPAGWGATTARTASLSPGASASAPVAITVPAGAAASFYAVSLAGANSAAALSASVASTIAVVSSLGVTVAANAASYTLPKQPNRAVTATITTTVKSGSTAVGGAAVTVTVTGPTGATTTLSGTTASNGTVAVAYAMRRNASPLGTYRVTSRAAIGGTSASATTTFVLGN
jgi:hypothetical protein